jgi:hypothetical protein
MIKLDRNYYIDSDGSQIILYKENITESGKNVGTAYGVAIGYYNTLEQAIKGYSRQVVYQLVIENNDLQGLLNAIKGLNDYIATLANGTNND